MQESLSLTQKARVSLRSYAKFESIALFACRLAIALSVVAFFLCLVFPNMLTFLGACFIALGAGSFKIMKDLCRNIQEQIRQAMVDQLTGKGVL
jgi:hypothetical protein